MFCETFNNFTHQFYIKHTMAGPTLSTKFDGQGLINEQNEDKNGWCFFYKALFHVHIGIILILAIEL